MKTIIPLLIIVFLFQSKISTQSSTEGKLPPEHQAVFDEMRRDLDIYMSRPYCVGILIDELRAKGVPICYVGAISKDSTDIDTPISKQSITSPQGVIRYLEELNLFNKLEYTKGTMTLVTVKAQDILTNSGLGKRKVLTIPKGSMFNALLALYEAYEVSIIADPYSLQRANEISLIDDIQIDNITFLEAMIMILGVNQSKGWTVLVNNDAVASGRRQIGFQLFE